MRPRRLKWNSNPVPKLFPLGVWDALTNSASQELATPSWKKAVTAGLKLQHSVRFEAEKSQIRESPAGHLVGS